MPIRSKGKPRSKSEIILLVEDDGLDRFLSKVLPVTSIAKFPINIIPGNGCAHLYKKYDELLDAGLARDRIIPILDADTLGTQTGPKRHIQIHSNPNMFRFRHDLEFAFAKEGCMLLDHALLKLLPGLFGEYGSVSALRRWSTIVIEARVATANGTGKDRSTLKNIKSIIRSKFGENPAFLNDFEMLSKVKLAEVLADLCLATGALPPEMERLFLQILAKALKKVRTQRNTDGPRPLWSPPLAAGLPERPANIAIGRILFASRRGGLRVASVSAGGRVRALRGGRALGAGAWLRDGRIAASVKGGDGVVLFNENDPAKREWIRQGVREQFLCFSKSTGRILIRGNEDQIFSVSPDNKSWSEIAIKGYQHCLAPKDLLAYQSPKNCHTILVQKLNNRGQSPQKVPDVIGCGGGLAWSHTGDRLAFTNPRKSKGWGDF